MQKNKLEVRTDLAIEARESYQGTNVEIKGVILEEEYKKEGNINLTKVRIETEEGARAMGKPIGTYITLESANLRQPEPEDIDSIKKELAEQISGLLHGKKKVLVVGLGNREATPDSLGPRTIEKINVLGRKGWEIRAIAPGVMAQTGMETARMVKGIVAEMKPEILIVIDSLAARSAKRLVSTIQLTDTGIHPGAGVGNHRQALNKETLGVDVIALGIPTVIESATIVSDTLDSLHDIFPTVIKSLAKSEKLRLIRELLEPDIRELYVTPKDIDENMTILGNTISSSLNMLWT